MKLPSINLFCKGGGRGSLKFLLVPCEKKLKVSVLQSLSAKTHILHTTSLFWIWVKQNPTQVFFRSVSGSYLKRKSVVEIIHPLTHLPQEKPFTSPFIIDEKDSITHGRRVPYVMVLLGCVTDDGVLCPALVRGTTSVTGDGATESFYYFFFITKG